MEGSKSEAFQGIVLMLSDLSLPIPFVNLVSNNAHFDSLRCLRTA
jgi:hypothetical protein